MLPWAYLCQRPQEEEGGGGGGGGGGGAAREKKHAPISSVGTKSLARSSSSPPLPRGARTVDMAARPGRFVAVGGRASIGSNVDGPGRGNHMVYLPNWAEEASDGGPSGKRNEANADTECCSGAVGLGDALPFPGSVYCPWTCIHTIFSCFKT